MLSPPRLPALWMGFNAGTWMASGRVCTGPGGSAGAGNCMQSHAAYACMAFFRVNGRD